MPNLTETIKAAAAQAVQAGDPAAVLFGTIKGVSPLQVQINQNTILPESFFLLTSNVRAHTVSMTVDHETGRAAGGEGEGAFDAHSHTYSGIKNFKVNNGLSVGDRVLLLRQQGGQLYVILDKLKEADR